MIEADKRAKARKTVSMHIQWQCLMAIVLLTICTVMHVDAQENNITNARILEMTSLKLGDDIIIGKIQSGTCSFQVADQDLLDLKKAGVSPQVIAAMVEASTITVPLVMIDQKPAQMHSFVGLQGKHAAVIAGSKPEIILELPKDDVIGNYVLVQLEETKDNRTLDLACRSDNKAEGGGIWYRKKQKGCDAFYRIGISNSDIRATSAISLGENRFKLVVDSPLKQGEYFLYIIEPHDRTLSLKAEDSTRGAFPRGFDFSVQ